MRKIKLGLNITSIILLILIIILLIQFSNGLILNLQVYMFLGVSYTMFWLLVILIGINILISDSGFLKIGAIIIIVTGVFTLVFQGINNTSTYELLTSDKYILTVETISYTNEEFISVYKKDNIFFSKYVGVIKVSHIYEFSYEIVGDTFIVTKCSGDLCITSELDLE
ncbi:MAG: hypothetical protein KQ78_00483 [Candidatus Izimaplasma bacterium HR2]|nr:MAG: hypothetical protein KQ78_00483 [Candidatus Izimaplasma bacterium HR2]